MIPHIQIEQAKAIYPNDIPGDCEGWLSLLNARIDKANAHQETYITAAQARELGAGNAEWQHPDIYKWYVCGEECRYAEYLKYRAIKQAQPEPVDHVKLLGEIYGFLQSTCPEGYADEAFHVVPEPLRAQAVAPYAESSNETGERVRHTQEAGCTKVDPHADLRAEYAKQIKEGTTGFYLWEFRCFGLTWLQCESAHSFMPEYEYRCTDISCYVSKDGEPAIRMLRSEAQELYHELGIPVEWKHNNNAIAFTHKRDFRDCKGVYTYRTKATIKLDGKMVTPEQVDEWRKEGNFAYGADNSVRAYADTRTAYTAGYLRAKTEQAEEIAELKAQLAELMPLAKFGAEVANHVDGMGAVSSVVIWRIAKRVGVLTEDESEYAPKIGDVIEQLLKD